ncbi:cupredoxin domain-containing protein [Bacteriovorax sp. DB6_IX]|uniref:cupredoxin domain-containing protein n=1 Tax=Bacteriovorax sp. DB6_IX TaxID=1353530 RepID=UPI00038A1655|nr:cupredoxin domain-containing protein [Bacteriovorax sp. DB6_IX]EQC52325.1 cupredoxin-like domain protein [Bacteriovorax sp. DB6_IX]
MKMNKFVSFLTFAFLMSASVLGLEKNYFKGENYEQPKREISIISSDSGYYPKAPTVFVGEQVRVFVTSTTNKPTCMIVKDQEFYVEAKQGEMSEGVLYFDKSGIHEFYCPASGHKGKIVVLEHPDRKKERIRRELASERKKKVKIWRPRDE